MKWLALMRRGSTVGDRWVMALTGVGIVTLGMAMSAEPGRRAQVLRDNRPLLMLPLDRDVTTQVEGRLGPVTIQVEKGRIRLLEYNSPRLIGTRTGWIQDAGRTTACVPCGILVQVEGRTKSSSTEFDAVAH